MQVLILQFYVTEVLKMFKIEVDVEAKKLTRLKTHTNMHGNNP